MKFPITLKVKSSFIQTMKAYEESSYYDQIESINKGQTPDFNPEKHTYSILDRYKTRIELRDVEELADFYYRLGSGLTKEHHPQTYKTCKRLQGVLMTAVIQFCPEVRMRWEINRLEC